MKTRIPRPVAIGCATLLLIGGVCSFTIFVVQAQPAFGPCEQAVPPPFSLGEASALQQTVLDTFLSGASGPFRLDVSSTALNSYVVWQTQGSPLYDPAVWFVPGHVCLRGTLGVLGPLQLHMAAAVRPHLVDGRVRVEIEYARLGGWVLPGLVRGYLADIASETIEDARLHIAFTELQLTDGHLLIAGSRNPAASRRQILPQSALQRNVIYADGREPRFLGENGFPGRPTASGGLAWPL